MRKKPGAPRASSSKKRGRPKIAKPRAQGRRTAGENLLDIAQRIRDAQKAIKAIEKQVQANGEDYTHRLQKPSRPARAKARHGGFEFACVVLIV